MTRRLSYTEFVDRAISVHGSQYSYDNSVYDGLQTKIGIVCHVHGEFWQTPSNHINNGNGCPRCAGTKTSERCRGNRSSFIRNAREVHGDKYRYHDVAYTTALTRVMIQCPDHGTFWQTPNKHLAGNGCQSCKGVAISKSRTISVPDCQSRVAEVRGDTYNYDWDTYINLTTPMKIICHEHGEFWQTPSNHISNKNDCPRCTSRVSKQCSAWLDSLDVPNDPQHREVRGLIPGRNYEVDGYQPDTKTVYEYYGDYWHGNPSVYDQDHMNPSCKVTYGALYEKTQARRSAFIEAGFNVVEKWETE